MPLPVVPAGEFGAEDGVRDPSSSRAARLPRGERERPRVLVGLLMLEEAGSIRDIETCVQGRGKEARFSGDEESGSRVSCGSTNPDPGAGRQVATCLTLSDGVIRLMLCGEGGTRTLGPRPIYGADECAQ